MNPDLKQILLKFDEVGAYEAPSDFDIDSLMRDAEVLRIRLENTFAEKFKIYYAQDASFLCDIEIPLKLVKNIHPHLNLYYSIRISNFGRLATINFQEELFEDTTQIIIEELKSLNFCYINNDDLDVEYDGNFEDFKNMYGPKNKPTWYTRYFDYL